jgi:hypothetical protein
LTPQAVSQASGSFLQQRTEKLLFVGFARSLATTRPNGWKSLLCFFKALTPNLVAGASPGRGPSKEASSPFFEKKGPKKLSPFVLPAAFLAPQAIILASHADRHADARSNRLRPSPPRDRDLFRTSKRIKVFCFFFSKKKRLLPTPALNKICDKGLFRKEALAFCIPATRRMRFRHRRVAMRRLTPG